MYEDYPHKKKDVKLGTLKRREALYPPPSPGITGPKPSPRTSRVGDNKDELPPTPRVTRAPERRPCELLGGSPCAHRDRLPASRRGLAAPALTLLTSPSPLLPAGRSRPLHGRTSPSAPRERRAGRNPAREATLHWGPGRRCHLPVRQLGLRRARVLITRGRGGRGAGDCVSPGGGGAGGPRGMEVGAGRPWVMRPRKGQGARRVEARPLRPGEGGRGPNG